MGGNRNPMEANELADFAQRESKPLAGANEPDAMYS
jgi:hypothetical protein